MAQLFTVLYPERVERLVLANSLGGASVFVAAHTAPDGSFEPFQEKLAGFGRLVETWGRDPQFFVDWFAPSQSGNESFVRWIGRLQRLSATAADLERQILSLMGLDGSERLGEITAPTLVAHGVRDAVCPVAVGHALAAAIPGATLAEFDTADHFLVSSEHWASEQDIVLEFLTGSRPQRRVERRFATVVFTDIVGSTARGTSAGDEGWCDLLDSHDRIAWEAADRHLGTIVKSTGDGLLARFDSPSQGVDFCATLRGTLIGIGLRIRCGVHTGEIEMRESGDIAGTAVNLAARVEEAAGDGEVFVSSTVRDMLLGGETRFEDRGEHMLKGFDSSWRMYALVTT
jgi:class 3 adenylate cyclase